MSISAPEAALPATQANSGEVSLRGFWLRALQVLWIVFVLVDLATLIISYPAFFQGLHNVCATSVQDCSPDQLTIQPFAALLRAGYSIDDYALYTLIVDVLTTIPYLLFGFLIFWRRSNTWMGLYVSFFLINLGSLGASAVHTDWMPEHGSALIEIVSIGSTFLGVLYYPILAFFFFMFPDGRLVPRWSWALIGLWAINAFFWITPDESLNINNWHPLLQSLWLFVVFGGSLSTQVYRYWRVASPIQRQRSNGSSMDTHPSC